jgi:RHS repeat-associated protein
MMWSDLMKPLLAFALLLTSVLPARAQTPVVVEYYHVDALGSVRAVTDQSGAVVQRHDYAAFGEELPPQAVGDSKLRFTGKERDAETGSDYFGARYYTNWTGRFTSVDPEINQQSALVQPQRWNRYSYALNQPLTVIDPDGRNPVLIGAIVVGALVVHQARLGAPSDPNSAPDDRPISSIWGDVVAVGSFFQGIGSLKNLIFGSAARIGAQANDAAMQVNGPRGLLPAINESTAETALATAAESGGRQGTNAFRALSSHIDRGDPAFQGVAKTPEAALDLVRAILRNPSRVASGNVSVDVYNAAGQGVRLDLKTGQFVGFLDASRATR